MRLTVAIDGPAGAGKSTIAELVAKKYNLMYINTGAMYRAITFKALKNNINPENITDLKALLQNTDMHFVGDSLILDGENVTSKLITPYISNNVSNYASIKEVRENLVNIMRNLSKKYDVLMDGRDIGTVVLKDATFKFFLTASAEERATRRFNELKSKGIDIDFKTLLEDIKKRDFIDSNREISPLKKADDAILIDSSNLNISEVVDIISNYIDNKSKEIN